MEESNWSVLMNSQTQLAHDCWGDECDGQIVVTLAQFVANYYARCPKPECRKPVLYGSSSGESHIQLLERLVIEGLARQGWKVVP